MGKDATNGIKQSLNESFKALGSTVKAAHNLAPCAVIVGAALVAGITWATLQWSSLMIGTASLMVVIVSLCIFAVRENFGEAMLSLVGGLLTIFAFEWTPARYIAFMAVWFGFAFAALLITSVKLAAKSEDIYRMASLRLANAGEDHEPIEKRLKQIGASTTLKMLGPIERAEIIRVLAFRKLPSADADADARRLVDTLYDVIKDVPVPPEDLFAAFETSRRLLISKAIPPIEFLEGLRDCLESGVAPNDVYDEMINRFQT